MRLSAEGATFMQAARNLLGAHERAIASFGSTRRHLVVGVSHLIVGSELPALLRRIREGGGEEGEGKGEVVFVEIRLE